MDELKPEQIESFFAVRHLQGRTDRANLADFLIVTSRSHHALCLEYRNGASLYSCFPSSIE